MRLCDVCKKEGKEVKAGNGYRLQPREPLEVAIGDEDVKVNVSLQIRFIGVDVCGECGSGAASRVVEQLEEHIQKALKEHRKQVEAEKK